MQTNKAFKDFLAWLAIAVLLLAIVNGVHGAYCDLIKDEMHTDCVMCRWYEYMHSDDAAFQTRQLRRAQRESKP